MKKSPKTKAKEKCWSLLSQIVKLETGCCQRCGGTDYLQAHHIIKRSHGMSTYYERDNIICLCRGCHFWLHTRATPQDEHELILKTIGQDKWNTIEELGKRMKKYKLNDLQELADELSKKLVDTINS